MVAYIAETKHWWDFPSRVTCFNQSEYFFTIAKLCYADIGSSIV